ncbi:hypothetical protein [Salininema proteolyticum]|uniref:Uncharacterized protein n=1 Tax=Salininema proteolyticum TaxID=1607685 RepID=A0ABV8TX77_9ACTN
MTIGITARQAAGQFLVAPSTVITWHTRGWKDPHTGKTRKVELVGYDSDGARLYLWDDLLAAERDTRRSHRSRRKAWCPQ